MSTTYDPSLSRDLDKVRLLCGDTNTARAMLTDEEIIAMLASTIVTATGEARNYFIAAELLSVLHTEYMTSGKGKASKKLSQLQIVYGTSSGINTDLALQTRISNMRKMGARIQARQGGKPSAFRMV